MKNGGPKHGANIHLPRKEIVKERQLKTTKNWITRIEKSNNRKTTVRIFFLTIILQTAPPSTQAVAESECPSNGQPGLSEV